LVVYVDNELVPANVIVILPRARIAGVNRLAAFVTKLATLARDVNRALRFGERRGAVGLFLAVVCGGGPAASVGNIVGEIGIELDRLGSGTRIPNGRIAAAQPDSLISGDVRNIRCYSVAIVLIELTVALRIDTLHVLRVL